MATIIDLLRQDINKRKEEINDHNFYLDNSDQALGYSLTLDDTLSFLASTEPKPESNVEKAFEEWWEEIYDRIGIVNTDYWYFQKTAEYFYDLGLKNAK